MKLSDYQYLVGKDKKNVIDDLGSEFNYYHSNIWTYHIGTNWLGKKTYLLLLFKNDTVHKIEFKKSYAKLRH